jgi:hypothetical protein
MPNDPQMPFDAASATHTSAPSTTSQMPLSSHVVVHDVPSSVQL